MTLLRVVLDSNVIVSGILFNGPPRGVLRCIAQDAVQCYASMPILDEVRDVLQRPKFGLSPEQSLAVVGEFRELCRIVAPTVRVRVVSADPDDDMVLECAAATEADVIVSGDSHLLNVVEWRGIPIIPPAEFLRRIEAE